PAITTDHRRRLTRFAEKRPTAATSPLQATKTSSRCIKAASILHMLRIRTAMNALPSGGL
ncbi:hypothetical protein NKI41_32005, partial [Mesorhizobium sp. M0601]|uniref:hypothetical protein n=1 Tax=Mesorhizobium sp. M0601 TaxID=2956969 RepID=UPI00333880CA